MKPLDFEKIRAVGKMAAKATADSISTPETKKQFLNEIFDKVYEPRIIEAPSGTIGFFVHEGVGRTYQEDRIVINTEKDSYASIDGMGGMGNGDKAAEILAGAMKTGFETDQLLAEIHERAHKEMVNGGVGEGGACYIGFQIKTNKDGKKMLSIGQAGDVRIFVINSDGHIVFETTDEGNEKGVWNAITGDRSTGQITLTTHNLNTGDRIVVASDGLTDNFNTYEIADMVHGKNTKDAIQTISDQVNLAMSENLPGRKVKKDNVNVILYDIGEKTDRDNEHIPSQVDLGIPETKPNLSEKELAIKNLREVIQIAQEQLAQNRILREALLQELAEIRKANIETQTTTESKENGEVKSYPSEFIEEKIGSLLASDKRISKVIDIHVTGKGENVALSIKVVAGPLNSNVSVQAILENKNGDIIVVKSYTIDASFAIKRILKNILIPKLEDVSQILKSYIEKEENKKVEKMEIEDGKLKVTFK